MNTVPLVSICIPTLNGARYLEACLQSALSQTFPNTEILISDDGSKDDTLEIVKKHQQHHPRIRLVQNVCPGMVNNWNNCIYRASGEWIKFLFQDDVLNPDCVERMLAECLQQKVDVGLCRREFIIQDDVPEKVWTNIQEKLTRPEQLFGDTTFVSPRQLATNIIRYLPQNVLGEPTCYLFNKRILKETGPFNPDLRQVVDYEFVLRLGLKKGLVFVNERLVLFRVHLQSESSSNSSKEKVAKSRKIAAIHGDFMLLFYYFLQCPEFERIKEAIGDEKLMMAVKYYYYSGCKHHGKGLTNRVLASIRNKYQEIGELKYHFLKYAYYRKQFKNWQRQNSEG